jgi:acyl-CoA synthetase (AMP-forming)/AMP-acid ligase II
MNASCTAQELLDDGRRLQIKAVVTTTDAAHRLELDHLRHELGCEIIYLTPKESGPAGLFELSAAYQTGSQVVSHPGLPPAKLHGLNDCSLILHTSGTSGKKKVVPYTLRSLIIGTLAVIKSWELREDDVNSECSFSFDRIGRADGTVVNMMPLFHVGGIVRNLWAPVFLQVAL